MCGIFVIKFTSGKVKSFGSEHCVLSVIRLSLYPFYLYSGLRAKAEGPLLYVERLEVIITELFRLYSRHFSVVE